MRTTLLSLALLAGCAASPPAEPTPPEPVVATPAAIDPLARKLEAAETALGRGRGTLADGSDPEADAATALQVCAEGTQLAPEDSRFHSLAARAHLLRRDWAVAAGTDEVPHRDAAETALAAAVWMQPLRAADLRLLARLMLERGDEVADGEDDPQPLYRGATAECSRALNLDAGDRAARELRYRARHSWLFWLRQQRSDDEMLRLATIEDVTILMDTAPASKPDERARWLRRRAELLRAQAIRAYIRGDDPREWFDRTLADFDAYLASKPDELHVLENASVTRLWYADATQRAARDSSALLERAAVDLRRIVDTTSLAYAWWQLGRVRHHQARNALIAGRDPIPWIRSAEACLDAWAVIEPDDPDLAYTHGFVARLAGDYGAAAKHYERWFGLLKQTGRRHRMFWWVQGFVKAARAGPDGDPAPWLRNADLGWWLMEVGRYDRSRIRFERAFALVEQAGALADPEYRAILANLRFDLACSLAVVSTGRPNTYAEATRAVPPAEVKRLRESAMVHLLAAEKLVPSSYRRLANDPDLEALSDDPRFLELLESRPW